MGIEDEANKVETEIDAGVAELKAKFSAHMLATAFIVGALLGFIVAKIL